MGLGIGTVELKAEPQPLLNGSAGSTSTDLVTIPAVLGEITTAAGQGYVGAPASHRSIGVGVIGYGYWGPNLVRNFVEVSGAEVVAVADLDPRRLEQLKTRYPLINTTQDHRALLTDPRIEAVAIATPVATHFRLAQEALRAGKHVLVEKPLAASYSQGQQLMAEARANRRVLMVDHTFVYTGAVRKIKSLVDSGELGRLYYYDSTRINLGLFQNDVNVLWDLAVHDIAIMDFVLNCRPTSVSATGIAHIPGTPVNIAYLTCFFDEGLIAHVHANWLAPTKLRRTLIGGDRKMIVYDDLEPSEKVKVYDKGVTVTNSTEGMYEMLVNYRTGDMWAPQLSLTEGLRNEVNHFLDCIQRDTQPITGGDAAVRVLRVLEAASESLSLGGCPVAL
jgi:predicted dehydrogenase